jgi:hypothetical protein
MAGGWTVSHGCFRTMGTPILQGREFAEADGAAAGPVVVVSRALAQRLWPGANPVGQELQILVLRTVDGKVAPDITARIKQRDPTLSIDMTAYEIQPRRVIGKTIGNIRAISRLA